MACFAQNRKHHRPHDVLALRPQVEGIYAQARARTCLHKLCLHFNHQHLSHAHQGPSRIHAIAFTRVPGTRAATPPYGGRCHVLVGRAVACGFSLLSRMPRLPSHHHFLLARHARRADCADEARTRAACTRRGGTGCMRSRTSSKWTCSRAKCATTKRPQIRLLRWHLQPPPPPTRKKHNIRCARNRALAESARRSRNRSAQRFEVYTVVKFRQALGFRLSALPPTCKRLRGVEFGHEAGSFGSHRSCLDAHMRSRERRACEAGEFCKIPPVLVMMPLIFLLFHCTRLACCHVALFVAKGNVEPRGNFRVFVHA